MTSPRKKNTVYVVAYDQQSHPVLREAFSLASFYEKPHPVLDNPQFRQKHLIVRLNGVICDDTASVCQEFEVCFDASGQYLCDAARFGDGAVTGNWEKIRQLAGRPA